MKCAIQLILVGCMLHPPILLGGCSSRVSTDRAVFFPADVRIIEPTPDDPPYIQGRGVQRRPIPVDVDLESFNGDVVIHTNPQRDEIRVQVAREAVHGPLRIAEAEDSLDEIDYFIELTAPPAGGVNKLLRIVTRTSHPEPHFQRAHVEIDAPAVGAVRIRTGNGRVLIEDARGAIDVETTEGDVRVMTYWPITDPVAIVNRDGDIDYRVRAESTGRFDAESVGGRVFLRQDYGDWEMVDTGPNQDRMVAQLNEGDNPVVLRTVDGMIRIAVVSDPKGVGTFIVDP